VWLQPSDSLPISHMPAATARRAGRRIGADQHGRPKGWHVPLEVAAEYTCKASVRVHGNRSLAQRGTEETSSNGATAVKVSNGASRAVHCCHPARKHPAARSLVSDACCGLTPAVLLWSSRATRCSWMAAGAPPLAASTTLSAPPPASAVLFCHITSLMLLLPAGDTSAMAPPAPAAFGVNMHGTASAYTASAGGLHRGLAQIRDQL
jgi:hypothetical protein